MKRLYVLVRGDLSRSQQAVQAGHAVAQWCANEAARWQWDGRDVTRPEWRWNNQNLIYLKVRNEKELRAWYEQLRCPAPLGQVELGAIPWFEPDWGNQMTALAVVAAVGEVFRDLDLL